MIRNATNTTPSPNNCIDMVGGSGTTKTSATIQTATKMFINFPMDICCKGSAVASSSH